MMRAIQTSLFFVLVSSCASKPSAVVGADVVDWSGEEGRARLIRAEAKADFFVLANRFEGQENKISCGPATVTIVLNSLRLHDSSAKRPLAVSGIKKRYLKQIPKGFEARFEKYTQANVLGKTTNKVKTEAQIYGQKIKGKKDFGLQLRQLQRIFQAHGALANLRVADATLTVETFRNEARENMGRDGDFVVVNYARKSLGQPGGGHISPLGAYDEASDSFLILDTNPNKANWVWVTTPALVSAMKTFDTVENRGYLLIREGGSKAD